MKNYLLFITLLALPLVSSAQIISYSINQEINGPGILYFDIDSDSQDDFYFDVIELSPNIFAARVTNIGLSSYLDNSTFNYPDALNYGDTVMGYFNNGNAVLGTFTGAGLFSGAGDKYLGIKIYSTPNYYYGWIKLNCNATNDTLKIISCGFNTVESDTITAGQLFANDLKENFKQEFSLYPNPATDQLYFDAGLINVNYKLFNSVGACLNSGKLEASLDVSAYESGSYFLLMEVDDQTFYQSLIINR